MAKRSCRLALMVLWTWGLTASAQEQPATFEFSFSNPGARSMALGGAFAALADDATAAFANPAGLVQLLEPEVSVEGRHTSRQTPFVAGGRVTVVNTGLAADVLDPDQVRLKDGDEIRLGIEYVFSHSRPIIALRLGGWRDPAHRVAGGPHADQFERAVFEAGKDQIHATGGLGLVFPRFQIDLGVDLADRSELASLSLVYRF